MIVIFFNKNESLKLENRLSCCTIDCFLFLFILVIMSFSFYLNQSILNSQLINFSRKWGCDLFLLIFYEKMLKLITFFYSTQSNMHNFYFFPMFTFFFCISHLSSGHKRLHLDFFYNHHNKKYNLNIKIFVPNKRLQISFNPQIY